MMKKTISLLCILLLACACTDTAPDSGSLERSVPEKEGVSSHAILKFIEGIEQTQEEWHSFVLLRHGKVIAEGWWDPYQQELKQTIYSTSKTFTATAIGFAVSEKRLSVEDKVISFFPDLLPDSVSPYLAQLRVRDLLTMTAGQDAEPRFIANGNEWVKDFLAVQPTVEPGTKFLYNSMATYMLSAIVQKVTGERTLDYLQPRLFTPLAIKDADWEISPENVNTGGWGLRLHTEDMAKLGQLFLQKGQWKGQQLLPEAWIEEATTAKINQKPDITDEQRAKDDWAQGYCYQMWRCRNNAFRADGAYGQYIIVMPEQDAVIAVQANLYDMQKEINLVWDYLLPAFQSEALPSDEQAVAALQQKLASLSIAPPAGTDANAGIILADETAYMLNNSGKNENFSLRIAGDTCFLTWNDYTFHFGKEKWLAGETVKPAPSLLPSSDCFKEFPPFKVYGSYCQQEGQTLSLSLKYIESPHTERITCRFAGDSIFVGISNSMNYGNITGMTGVKR